MKDKPFESIIAVIFATGLILSIIYVVGGIISQPDHAQWKDIPNICKREYNATMVGLKYTRKCGGMAWGVVCHNKKNNYTFVEYDWKDSTDYQDAEVVVNHTKENLETIKKLRDKR